jgi:hypothetical protein
VTIILETFTGIIEAFIFHLVYVKADDKRQFRVNDIGKGQNVKNQNVKSLKKNVESLKI